MTEKEYEVLKNRIFSEFSSTLDKMLRPALGLEIVYSNEDRIKEFINDKCTISPVSKVGSTELYKSYEGWAIGNNHKLMTHTIFSRTLKNMMYEGIEYKREREGAAFQGLALK